MPVTTNVTTTRTITTGSNVAVHTISFRGIAGAIFITLAVSLLLYIIAFATTGWTLTHPTATTSLQTGLWEKCTCTKQVGSDEPAWHRAVQAMITIGLIGLIAAFVLICIYLTVHSISKNITIIVLTAVIFASVLFMLIGFIVWGVHTQNQHFSFAFAVIAAITTLAAGILCIVQMRQSNVHM